MLPATRALASRAARLPADQSPVQVRYTVLHQQQSGNDRCHDQDACGKPAGRISTELPEPGTEPDVAPRAEPGLAKDC